MFTYSDNKIFRLQINLHAVRFGCGHIHGQLFLKTERKSRSIHLFLFRFKLCLDVEQMNRCRMVDMGSLFRQDPLISFWLFFNLEFFAIFLKVKFQLIFVQGKSLHAGLCSLLLVYANCWLARSPIILKVLWYTWVWETILNKLMMVNTQVQVMTSDLWLLKVSFRCCLSHTLVQASAEDVLQNGPCFRQLWTRGVEDLLKDLICGGETHTHTP